jgi:hypothetical protein
VRIERATVGLAVLAMLVGAPAASASTASLQDETVVFQGDAAPDDVTLARVVDTRGNVDPGDDVPYYLVTDADGIRSGDGCDRVSSTTSACRVSAGLKAYAIATRGGADTVEITGATAGGRADLGRGDDRFTGLATGASAEVIAGGPDDDAIDGGGGDDTLEFGAADMAPGGGLGADDLRGGDGVDLLSYNDHAAGIELTLDEQPGDGSAGEGDNVHADVEIVIGTTLDDVMTGDEAGQDLYGHAGWDWIEGAGGADLLNGGSGEDVLLGGAGDDGLEGSAGGDYLDGGAGQDAFFGDNDCTADPCTGGSDDIQARDGEEDTVNCGVGADRATVDALDIVALDTQHGCERVDREAVPAAPVAPAAPAGAPPGAAAAAVLPTMRVRGGRGLRRLLKRGLRVDVTCPGACRVRARLILHSTFVAGGRKTRISPGVAKLRVKTRRAGRRKLRRRTKVLLTLAVDVTDGSGQKTTLAQPLRFKR